MLLDPQGIRHSPAFNILLQLYSIYFIKCPICYIHVLREIRPKLPVFNDLRGGKSKATRFSISTHKTRLVLVKFGTSRLLHVKISSSAHLQRRGLGQDAKNWQDLWDALEGSIQRETSECRRGTFDTWDMGDYLPRKYFDYVCKKHSD